MYAYIPLGTLETWVIRGCKLGKESYKDRCFTFVHYELCTQCCAKAGVLCKIYYLRKWHDESTLIHAMNILCEDYGAVLVSTMLQLGERTDLYLIKILFKVLQAGRKKIFFFCTANPSFLKTLHDWHSLAGLEINSKVLPEKKCKTGNELVHFTYLVSRFLKRQILLNRVCNILEKSP